MGAAPAELGAAAMRSAMAGEGVTVVRVTTAVADAGFFGAESTSRGPGELDAVGAATAAAHPALSQAAIVTNINR